MKTLLGCMSVLAIVITLAAGSFAKEAAWVTEGGLTYRDLKVGSGAVAEIGKIAVIHFTGWIDKNGKRGEKFFSSHDQDKPVAFKIGTDMVIEGWNRGVVGMQEGGRRRLMVPAALGYGAGGAADIVPPNADLIYDIELIEVR
jgi:FKBP-type peptidyl-prolyl cis-trans isomerase FkpA